MENGWPSLVLTIYSSRDVRTYIYDIRDSFVHHLTENVLIINYFVVFRSYSVSQVLQPHGGASNPPGPPSNAKPTVPGWKRPTHPPVRIDTCIVGDDTTCDAAQHERCRTELGVSSCLCRPGYSRRKHRDPCHSTYPIQIHNNVCGKTTTKIKTANRSLVLRFWLKINNMFSKLNISYR